MNILYNFDNDEIEYFIKVIDDEMSSLDTKYNALKDLRNEFTTFLSNNKEE